MLIFSRGPRSYFGEDCLCCCGVRGEPAVDTKSLYGPVRNGTRAVPSSSVLEHDERISFVRGKNIFHYARACSKAIRDHRQVPDMNSFIAKILPDQENGHFRTFPWMRRFSASMLPFVVEPGTCGTARIHTEMISHPLQTRFYCNVPEGSLADRLRPLEI